jgi:hypothetical protein
LEWYSHVEEEHAAVAPGTRFLLRRDHSVFHHQGIMIDYVTERIGNPNRYGGWEHVTVVYLDKESSPYLPYHYDLHPPMKPSVAGMVFLQHPEPQQ